MRSVTPVLAAVLLASPVIPAPRLKEKPPTDCYWPTVVGTTIEIQSDVPGLARTEVVTSVERARGITTVVTRKKGTGTDLEPAHKVEIRPDGVYLLETGGYAYTPPVRILKLPLRAGDTWTAETKWAGAGAIAGAKDQKYVFTVGETKVFDTPAGKFEAVQVVWEQSSGFRRGVTTRTPRWYSKDVGLVSIEGKTTLKSVQIPNK